MASWTEGVQVGWRCCQERARRRCEAGSHWQACLCRELWPHGRKVVDLWNCSSDCDVRTCLGLPLSLPPLSPCSHHMLWLLLPAYGGPNSLHHLQRKSTISASAVKPFLKLQVLIYSPNAG